MQTNYRQKDFFIGALIGSTVATLSALLFTTKKGKEIQGQIGDLYENIEEKVKSSFSDAKNKVGEFADKAGKKMSPKSNEDKAESK